MENYKDVKEELIEVTCELADKVMKMMSEIDEYNFGKYEIREYHSNICRYSTLCLSGRSLLDVEQEFYLHNDLSIRIIGASIDDAMEFISDAPDLLANVQKRKEEKITAMSTSVEIAKMILSE